jgi:hypothetical protein
MLHYGRTDETSADGGLSAVAATRPGLPLPAAGQQLHGLQRSGMVRRQLFLGLRFLPDAIRGR